MNYPKRRARRKQRERELDELPNRAAPTTASIVSKVPGTHEQIAVLRAAVTEVDVFGTRRHRAAAHFLIHILTTAPLDDEDDGFVPVPAKAIEKHLRHLDWQALEDAGIIEIKPFCRVQRKSREFRASFELQRAFYEAGPTAERVAKDGLYDLVSGNPTQARKKSQRRTKSGNPLPKTIRKAIDSVREVPIDTHAIERHLDRLRRSMDEAEDPTARVTAQGRYFNDLRCYSAVLTQGARPIDPNDPSGLWLYRPAYKPQRFGRVSQIGGGLQSCSTAMKAVAYPPSFPPLL